MSETGRTEADDVLVVALARGATKESAAIEAGISVATVFRRLRSAEFRRRVEQTRGEMLEAGVGKLANLTSKAADILDKLLDSDDDKTKLAAAKTIWEHAGKGIDSTTILNRLAEVERLLSAKGENDAEGSGPEAAGGVGAGRGEAGRPGGNATGGSDPDDAEGVGDLFDAAADRLDAPGVVPLNGHRKHMGAG